jgi:hypothetical protein
MTADPWFFAVAGMLLGLVAFAAFHGVLAVVAWLEDQRYHINRMRWWSRYWFGDE